MPKLEYLDVSFNRLRPAGARYISEICRDLSALYIGGNEIGLEGVRVIASNLRSLAVFSVRGLPFFFILLARCCSSSHTHTHCVYRSFFPANVIGHPGVRLIAENMGRRLRSLDVASNDIRDEGAQVIAERLPDLTSLDIAGWY